MGWNENWRKFDEETWSPPAQGRSNPYKKKAEDLNRSDVIRGVKPKGVECQECHKVWRNGALWVCNECVEYFCDDHIENHGSCTKGK